MNPLLIIGIILFVGLLAGKGAYALRMPALVGYIVFGLLLGESVTGIISKNVLHDLGMIIPMVLGIIGFTVGGQLGIDVFRKHGSQVMTILFMQTIFTTLLVGGAVYMATRSLPMAMVVGPLASATAPAATLNVLWETKAKGSLTTMIMAIVALDDAVAIILFGLGEAIAVSMLSGKSHSMMQVLTPASLEVAGGILLGAVAGIVTAQVLKRITNPHTALIFSMGLIMMTAGLAQTYHLSLMLATLTAGMVAFNLAHAEVTHLLKTLEDITPPLYLMFFVLIGAELDIRWLSNIGVVGLIYIFTRGVGKWFGSWAGASFAGAELKIRRYLGPALLSQAGVAIGLSLVVLQDFSGLGTEAENIARTIVNLVAATTLLMELVGPIMVKRAVTAAGEVNQ